MKEFVNLENKTRLVGYKEAFKNLISANPQLIEHFFKLTENIKQMPSEGWQAVKKKGFYQEGEDMKVTCLDIRRGYYVVEVQKDKFFVKYIQNNSDMGGYEEFKSSQDATKIIQSLDWVEVLDFQLGYTDHTGRKVFVSKWNDLPTLSSYLTRKNIDIEVAEQPNLPAEVQSERKDILQKLETLENLLEKFFDVRPGNMFYDSEKKHIVLFDLNQTPG